MPKQQLKDIHEQNIQSQVVRTRRSQYQERVAQLRLRFKGFLRIVFICAVGVFVSMLLLPFFDYLNSYYNKASNSSIQSQLIILSILVFCTVVFTWIWFMAAKIVESNRRNAPPRYYPTIYRPSPLISTTNVSSCIRVRIVEEPLTAQNFSTIISALTELHTKCWLIAKGRFSEVIEYSQTRNIRFPEQAHLVITKITQNSPVDMKLNVNADASTQGIMEALKIGIDAVTQAPLRYKETKLANQAKELELKIKELEAQSELEDNVQTREINAQQADIERQKAHLELERQKLEIERQTIALQKERLDFQIATRDFAFDTATMMIEKLYPEVDKSTKAILIRTLLPELLQLNNCKGLELALPEPKSDI